MKAPITDRPILFSAPMVRALLAGTKTQTRRVVKRENAPSPGYSWAECMCAEIDPADVPCVVCDSRFGACPYGEPGDTLWVVTMRPVRGYEGIYDVGDDGHVYRIDGDCHRRLKGSPSSKGYLCVSLSSGGKIKTHAVHRVVAEAFYPEHHGLSIVRHLDGNPTNNEPTNLDWGTHSQNRADREAHGRGNGEAHHSAKLTEAIANEIRASAEPTRALARKYGVAQPTVQRLRAGKSWASKEAPPANLPRWASRITLRVTSVRVERVQDISEEDARAEGIKPWGPAQRGVYGMTLEKVGPVYSAPYADIAAGGESWTTSAARSFRGLWESINGAESWEANPYVWVVGFERVESAVLAQIGRAS